MVRKTGVGPAFLEKANKRERERKVVKSQSKNSLQAVFRSETLILGTLGGGTPKATEP